MHKDSNAHKFYLKKKYTKKGGSIIFNHLLLLLFFRCVFYMKISKLNVNNNDLLGDFVDFVRPLIF